MNTTRRLSLAWGALFYVCAAVAALCVLALDGCQCPARSQWGGSSCTPVGRDLLEWRRWAKDPERYYLYRGTTILGGWCPIEEVYRNYDSSTGTWSPPATPPLTPPAPPAQNFGLEQEKLNGSEKAKINGRATTPAEALQTIQNQVPEIAKKQRVVVIDANQERRQQVRKEVASLPECQDCVVQDYPPDHWHLLDLKTRRPGFVTGGAPTLYLLAADGKVLHRQDDYAGGAAAAAEAFRRARPDYDPRRDPDRRKPKPEPLPPPQPSPSPPAPTPLAVPPWTWLLVLGGAALFILQRRQA